MFYQNRDDTRTMFFTAWSKARNGQTLQPLEQQIVDVVTMHPEYHALLTQAEYFKDQDFSAEQGQSNPFLHMGLHIALHEQVSTDQPSGIRKIHQQIMQKSGDLHTGEHLMIECLAQALWYAQRNQQPPDMTTYIDCLHKLT